MSTTELKYGQNQVSHSNIKIKQIDRNTGQIVEYYTLEVKACYRILPWNLSGFFISAKIRLLLHQRGKEEKAIETRKAMRPYKNVWKQFLVEGHKGSILKLTHTKLKLSFKVSAQDKKAQPQSESK